MREIKPDQEIILAARMGSFAYGLDTEFSDVDVSGVYLDPPERFLGINYPSDKKLTVDNTSDDYDYSFCEVSKYCRLAAGGNPTVTEVMFSPEFITMTEAGKLLVDNRHIFLSQRARNSFAGYAYGQAKKLEARQGDFGSDLKKRYAKNARHLFRLFAEGRQVLEAGDLKLKVTAEERQGLFDLGELPWQELVKVFEEEDAKFKDIKSDLPLEPDMDAINDLCLQIRTLRSI